MNVENTSSADQITTTESSRIIFVRPEDWMITQYLTPLIRSEHRAVILTDPQLLGKALRIYKNSIVLFNIDRPPTDSNWYSVVADNEGLFKQNRTLPVFLGKATRDSMMARVKLSIPHDAIDMGRSQTQIYTLMNALLDQWYNQGKRQYIRVNCSDDGKSRFNLRYDGDPSEGNIVDISSAGMACTFDPRMEIPNLRRGFVLNKIQLKLGSRLLLLDGVVMGARIGGSGGNLYVIMFRNHTNTAAVQKIKDFVRECLQKEFDKTLTYE